MALPQQHLNPGDLIRSELMNDILGELAALGIRVTALESIGPSGSTDGVVITQVSPLSVRVGETLTVSGRNFGWTTGATSIVLDGQLVTAIASGSNSQVIFTVPDPADSPPAGGRQAQLLVSNATTSASTVVTVLPRAGIPEGEVELTYVGTVPDTPVAAAPFLVEFRAISRRSETVTVTLGPRVSTGWGGLRVLADGSPPQPLVPPQLSLFTRETVSFFVEVPVPAGTAATTSFTVDVTGAGAGVTSASQPKTFQVGTAAQQEADYIDLSTPLAGNAVSVARGGLAIVSILCEFAQAGNYNLTPRFGPAGASGWQVDTSDAPHPIAITSIPASGLARPGWVPVPLHFGFTAPAAAPPNQPLSYFIDVAKEGQTVKRTLALKLTAT